jgi:4-amino-4-deoxy-L-arabinose transferase-like glycosyltransferase
VRAAALFALLVTASFATRQPFLRYPFLNVDEAAHLVGSWELLHGGKLYVDFADNKPPLIHLFYAAAQLSFGEGILAVRLFAALLLTPLTALGASAFFGHSRRGKAAALAFIVASAALLASDAHAVHCEHVMLLPLAWCLALLRSPRSMRRAGRLFLAGALLGLATLAKQPAAACLLVPLAGVARAEQRRSRGARADIGRVSLLWGAVLAGFSLPLGAAHALFALDGTLASAVFWIWRYNLAHIANPMPFSDVVLRVLTMGGLVAPAALALLAAAIAGRRSRSTDHRRELPAILAAATFFPALLGLRLFGHYFLPFLFALSLAAAPCLGARRQSRLRGPIIAFGVFAAVGRFVYDPERPVADASRPEYERIGEALRNDRTCAGGPLFVWGYAPAVYAYAEKRPASRFVVPIDTLTGYLAGNDASAQGRIDTSERIVSAHWDQLMADLARRPPAHVVDTAPADLNRWGRFGVARFPRLLDLLARDYHVQAVVAGAVIYRRNECSLGH